MPYPDFPDRKLPYDINGTIVGWGSGGLVGGIGYFLNSTEMAEANDVDTSSVNASWDDYLNAGAWWFFPEVTVVTGCFLWWTGGAGGSGAPLSFEGSADSGNGVDGTWETPTYGGGRTDPFVHYARTDDWRTTVTPVTFTQPLKAVRFHWSSGVWIGTNPCRVVAIHLYGHKDTGQSPDDIIFIDSAGTGNEWAKDPDFGDVPYLSGATKQFKIKNTSSTKTANTISLTCADADFTISADGVTYGSSISLSSLAPNTLSATYYIKVSPSVLSLPGPRETRIKSVVGSWT